MNTPLGWTNIMPCVCVYCWLVYQNKDGGGVVGDSHGICNECYEKKVWVE